jgi:hypothetical protein
MSSFEASHDIVVGLLWPRPSSESENAGEYHRGARLLLVESLLSRHKELRDNPGGVGPHPLIASAGQAHLGPAHGAAVTSRCACCRVVRTASVDSAP